MIRGNVCRRGFVHCLADVGRLPAITIEATELPKHVLALLDHLLDLGGATAIRTRATPSSTTRYEHDQGAVEIVVSNRAILLFTADSEAVRRIHQVCCRLGDIMEAKPRRLPPRALPVAVL